jgi:hypothetical protein
MGDENEETDSIVNIFPNIFDNFGNNIADT